jgi:DNA-binding response OmpR family regulator
MQMQELILVVDDEKKIVDIVKAYLEKDGFRVITAYDGKAAIDAAKAKRPDLIILDLMLPGISGFDVTRTVRGFSRVPIIMLTARDDTADKILGLELGSDDYVTKPFNAKELVSRVRAVLRRYEASPPAKPVDGLVLDTEKRTVAIEGRLVELTQMEFDMLRVMAESPGRVFSRMQLLDRLQGDSYEGYERTIDSHIKNLRKKIEPDPDNPKYVLTVHGVGYKVAG